MTQRTPRHGETGIALVSALLVLVLAMVLSATFMMTVVGERNMSAGTHGSRTATYAADAGVRTMQQMVTNMARARMDSLTNAWSGSGAIITNPAAVFNGTTLNLSCANPKFDAVATITFLDSAITATQQTFDYQWTIQSTSSGQFASRRQVESSGTLRLSAARGSFTDYLVYTNHHTSPSGNSIWFTSRTSFNGRVHTNGRFRFAYEPTFNDLVTSVSQTAQYYDEGRNIELDADHNGTIDVPRFNGGFNRAVPSVSLPENAFSQMNAALGLSATTTTAPDNATINAQLGRGLDSNPPPNGIYVAASGGVVSGGLFVQGNVDDCKLSIDNSGRQVYELTQGSETRRITVDVASNHTLVYDGSTTTTLSGTPRGMMYVTGRVSSLRGPDRANGVVVPAVARQTKLLITAGDDIVITRDIVCDDYNTGTNVLGLYTADGAVRVATSAPDYMNLDAFVMAAGSNGIFGVDDYDRGSPRGTFTLRGGMITDYYGAFGTFSGTTQTSGYGRSFQYDRRGVTPPYFPTTGRFAANDPTATRATWLEL